MPAYRYGHKGNARAAVLSLALGGTTGDLTITGDDLTGWPTGVSSRPFVACLNRGNISEEKILCASRTGNVITVYSTGFNGRGWDDTAISAHNPNATLEHVWSATEADDVSAHLWDFTSDIHPQYALRTSLTRESTGTTDTLVIGDAFKLIEYVNASPITVTVPTNASVPFTIGTRIDILQTGAGQVTVAPAGGVTVNSSTGLSLFGQWSAATLIKRATNTWVLVGGLA